MIDLNEDFLPYIYSEGLYIIDAPVMTSPAETPAMAEKPAAKEPEEKPTIKYLGANEKGVMFIVNDPSHDFLNTQEHGFLMKIVESGLRMSKLDIAIINTSSQPFDKIIDEIPGRYVIGFQIPEVETLAMGYKYVVQETEGKKILWADKLSEIEVDQEKKQLLWNALQVMFDIQKTKS